MTRDLPVTCQITTASGSVYQTTEQDGHVYMRRVPATEDEARRRDHEWVRLLVQNAPFTLNEPMILTLEGIGVRLTTPIVDISFPSSSGHSGSADTQTGVSTTTSYKPEPHRSSYEDHHSPALGLALGGATGVGYLPLL